MVYKWLVKSVITSKKFYLPFYNPFLQLQWNFYGKVAKSPAIQAPAQGLTIQGRPLIGCVLKGPFSDQQILIINPVSLEYPQIISYLAICGLYIYR